MKPCDDTIEVTGPLFVNLLGVDPLSARVLPDGCYVARPVEGGYTGSMEPIDEAKAFQMARDLIAEHGDDVAAVLQAKIDELWAARDVDGLAVWFIVRNAVAMTLESDSTLH